ncbi:MAG: hypothetical protein Q4A18_05015 [Rikenellaceae bacterium]|nr:hypothetical protein [Rikenellaceae bacterium]
MKNNKKNYRLVARLQGEALTIGCEEMKRLAADYDRRVASLYAQERNEDRRAHLASVEMERKGDFLWACGARVLAMRAYLEAEKLALDGRYYDHERGLYPAGELYHRSRELAQKIHRCAAADRRLLQLVDTYQISARLQRR